jgi:hypothetical protein
MGYNRIRTITLDFRGESSHAEKELRRVNTTTPTIRTTSPRKVNEIEKKLANATATRAHGQIAE